MFAINHILLGIFLTLVAQLMHALVKRSARSITVWFTICLVLLLLVHLISPYLLFSSKIEPFSLHIIVFFESLIPPVFCGLAFLLFRDHYSKRALSIFLIAFSIGSGVHIHLSHLRTPETFLLHSITQNLLIWSHSFILLGSAFIAWKEKSADMVIARIRLRFVFVGICATLLMLGIFFKQYTWQGRGYDSMEVFVKLLLSNFILVTSLLFVKKFGSQIWTPISEKLLDESRTTEDSPAILAGSATRAAPLSELAIKTLYQFTDKEIYLNENLNFVEFARQMKVPEYKLRRCIHEELGYRNFNTMLSEHRIRHAQKMILQEKYSNEKIISIAFMCGYSSLAPFNKHFKLYTGYSPSDFRSKNSQKSSF
jgi:AraC-like DNA-binding protein